jgi:hypothetical protein
MRTGACSSQARTTPEMLALYLGLLDADFTIVDSPELVDALRRLTGRYQRAIDASERAPG